MILGTPSGRPLKWRAVSDGPLSGGVTVSRKHFVVFDHFDPLYIYSPLMNGIESDWGNTRILTYVTKKSLIFY